MYLNQENRFMLNCLQNMSHMRSKRFHLMICVLKNAFYFIIIIIMNLSN